MIHTSAQKLWGNGCSHFVILWKCLMFISKVGIFLKIVTSWSPPGIKKLIQYSAFFLRISPPRQSPCPESEKCGNKIHKYYPQDHFFQPPKSYTFTTNYLTPETELLKEGLFTFLERLVYGDGSIHSDVSPTQKKRRYIDTQSVEEAATTQERKDLFGERGELSLSLSSLFS